MNRKSIRGYGLGCLFAEGLSVAFILASGGNAAADMALRLIQLQDLLHLKEERTVKGGETLREIFMYGCHESERLHDQVAQRLQENLYITLRVYFDSSNHLTQLGVGHPLDIRNVLSGGKGLLN